MKRYALKDVDPVAITLCKQGANRKRIFLRKSTAALELPEARAGQRLLKEAHGDDWSVFYCVVAEPGSEEDPGMVGDKDSVDVWASEDEIRKAAHRLLKNKAYVNLMHDALGEEGCTIVENAVAQADFSVAAPDGEEHTIRKGSWYIAVEPNDDAKAKVDAGEIEGISLEGDGVRVLLEKAGPGSADRVSPEARRKLKGIIAKYRKAPHPWHACMRDNAKRFAKPEAVCGVLKKLAGRTKVAKAAGEADDSFNPDEWVDSLVEAGVTDENVDGFVDWADGLRQAHQEKEALKKLYRDVYGEDVELPPDLRDELAKATATFAEVIAERDLTDNLWRAWSALEGVVFDAFRNEDTEDPKAVIRQSLQEFEVYLLAKLDAVPDAGERNRLAKECGSLEGTSDEEGMDVGLSDDLKALQEKVDGQSTDIKKASDSAEASAEAVKGLVGITEKLLERMDAKKPEDEPDTVEGAVKKLGEVADAVDKLDGHLTAVAKSIEKLGDGPSTQGDEPDSRIRKNSDNPLAGLLA